LPGREFGDPLFERGDPLFERLDPCAEVANLGMDLCLYVSDDS
jgi:hypothetical protein